MDTIIKRCRSIIKYLVLFGCICNLLLLSTTLYVMQVFDRVLSSGSLETLWALTALALFALMLLAAIQAGRIWMLSKAAEWLERQLEGRLFLLAINNKDLMTPFNALKGYLTSQGFIALIDLPWSLLFIAVMFILHVYMGWLTICGVVIVITMAYLSYRYSRSLLHNYQRHTQRSVLYLKGALENADTLRSMGDLDAVTKDWHEINTKVQGAQLVLAKRQVMLSEMGRFFRLSLQIAVTGIGAYLVLKNELSMGAIIVGSTLLGRVLSPIEITIATWTNLLQAYRAYSLLKEAHDVHKGEALEEGDLIIDEVSFVVRGMSILKDVAFTLEQGTLLVLMGHSGAGKSTLIKILAGSLHPTRGIVRRGRSLGYAPQSGTIFPGTIGRTIARMSLSPDMDEVKRVAKMVGADWIEELPYGYNTPLDPKALSLGQRQQLILARAWYGNPTLVLLDEPDAFLDGHARGCFIESLITRDRKTTLVVVTHNPDIVKIADRILILQGGRVAAFDDRSLLTQ